MKKFIFSIAVILLAIIISVLFLIFTSEKDFFAGNDNKNSDSENLNGDLTDAEEAQNEINAQDSNPSANQDSSGSESNSGGGGGSGGGSSTPSAEVTTSYCPQISYALRNFIKNSECLSSFNGICTNKVVYCSVIVENLDQSAGQFTIEISLYNLQSLEIIQQFQISKGVSPSEQVIFEKSLSFQSQQEDGDANKDYDCSFKTLEIPKKSGC